MTVVDIAVPMQNVFWDIACVKKVTMEMERYAKVGISVLKFANQILIVIDG